MTIAIFGDALLDPATGETVREAVVVIEDGHVARAGRREGAQVPRDAEMIDAEGLTLLPGLIDCHVHLTSLGEGLDFARELTTPPTLELMRAVRAARRTLDAGFTSVRDAAGSPAGVRMAIDAGYFPGPRIFVTVSALSQTGGHTDAHFICGADLDIPLPDRPHMVVDGIENMRLRVREVIRAGADWIKLCTSGGVLSPGDQPHHPALTLDEIRAAVDEAATQGRKVMAHAQANAGIKNALKAGVATIEHGIWLDGDAIEMMLDGGNALIPDSGRAALGDPARRGGQDAGLRHRQGPRGHRRPQGEHPPGYRVGREDRVRHGHRRGATRIQRRRVPVDE